MTDKEKKGGSSLKWEDRLIDFIKFSKLFGRPLERVYEDPKFIFEVIGETTWIGFWAWRGYCFHNQIHPDKEPLFSEFASMFSTKEIIDMYKEWFGEGIDAPIRKAEENRQKDDKS